MDKTTALFNCEVKKVDEKNREVEIVFSTSDMDRDGEVIDAKGWDFTNYMKNPVVLWGHDSRSLPIGLTTKLKNTSTKVKGTVRFATAEVYPFADTVYRLIKGNYLNAVSVGFMPTEWKDGDPSKGEPYRTYLKQELLEVSVVTVPSNMNALVTAKEAGDIDEKAFAVAKGIFEGLANPKATDPPQAKQVAPQGEIIEPQPNGAGEGEKEAPEGIQLTDLTKAVGELIEQASGVVKHENYPMHSDTPWDEEKAIVRLFLWAGGADNTNFEKYAKGFGGYDPERTEELASYILPHHDVKDGRVVTVWGGVTHAMACLLCDATIPKRAEIYAHLKQHYAEHDATPPDLRVFDKDEVKEMFEGFASEALATQPEADSVGEGNGRDKSNDFFAQILTEVKQEKAKDENDLTQYVAGAIALRKERKQ